MNELSEELQSLLTSVTDYESNPTKAESKRIRIKLGELKKKITELRAELIMLDKAGY